ncbi:MAG: DUF2833 domain-containing protein [Candidatus Thalassarchaeaceae archaeon]|nr:DUF2833 domain-containing protein [Candidatus Thalassarchaeaceae archaeon]
MPVPSDTTDYTIRPSIHSDIFYVAHRMREEDVAEVRAAGGLDPVQALIEGFKNSRQCYTAEWKGEPFIMFGVAPVDDVSGAVWLLGTPTVTKARVAFLKESRRIIDEFHDDFPLLFNFVDARNKVHIRWIEWLGFTFINNHESFGFECREFLEFLRIRKCVNP